MHRLMAHQVNPLRTLLTDEFKEINTENYEDYFDKAQEEVARLKVENTELLASNEKLTKKLVKKKNELEIEKTNSNTFRLYIQELNAKVQQLERAAPPFNSPTIHPVQNPISNTVINEEFVERLVIEKSGLESQICEQKREIELLSSELISCKNELTNKTEFQTNASALAQEVTKLETDILLKIQQLEESNSYSLKLEAECKLGKQLFQDALNSISAEKEEIQQQLEKEKGLNEKLHLDIEQLNNLNELQNSKLTEHLKEMDTSQSNEEKLQINKLENENTQLKDDAHILSAKIEEQNLQLIEAKQSQQNNEITQILIETKEKQISDLKIEIMGQQAKDQTYQTQVGKQMKELNEELKLLKSDYTDLQNFFKSENEKFLALETEKHTHEELIDVLLGQIEKLTQSKKENEQRIYELEIQVSGNPSQDLLQLNENIRSLEEKIRYLEEKENELTELKGTFKIMSKESNNLTVEIEGMKTKLGVGGANNGKLKEEVTKLGLQMKEKDNKIEEMRWEIEELTEANNTVKSEKQRCKQDMVKQDEQLIETLVELSRIRTFGRDIEGKLSEDIDRLKLELEKSRDLWRQNLESQQQSEVSGNPSQDLLQLNENIRNLEEKIRYLEEKEGELTELKGTFKIMSKESNKEQEIQLEIGDLKTELKTAKNKLKSEKKSSQIDKQLITKLNSDIMKLPEADPGPKIADLERQLFETERARIETEQKLGDMATEIANRDSKIQILDQNIVILQNKGQVAQATPPPLMPSNPSKQKEDKKLAQKLSKDSKQKHTDTYGATPGATLSELTPQIIPVANRSGKSSTKIAFRPGMNVNTVKLKSLPNLAEHQGKQVIYQMNKRYELGILMVLFETTTKLGLRSVTGKYAGIKLHNPVGNCSGEFRTKRLFECEQNYGICVPYEDVLVPVV